MFDTVETSCDAHESDWETVSAFGEIYGLYKSKVAEARLLAYQHTQSLIGVRAYKDEERERAIEKVEVIANALRSLGAVSGEVKLNEHLRFSHTALIQSNATRLIQYVDSILEEAAAHTSELPAYGVSQEKLDEMMEIRDQLVVTLGTPRNAIVLRKTLTEAMDELVHEIDELLKNNLDPLVEVMKADFPKFSKLYKAARVVVDHKGKSNKPKKPLPPTAPNA